MYKIFCAIIILTFFNINLFAQKQDVNPNGYNKFFYPNGQISSEGYLRNGKPDGYWKTYYVNGKIKSEGNRKNYLLDSIWNFYDEKGRISKKISYRNGKRNGYLITYDYPFDTTQAVIISKELYVDDMKQGKSFYYYNTGILHLEIDYKDNLKHGNAREYDSLGNVITLMKYRYDNLVDREAINRRDKNGRKQGRWVTFFSNGNIKTDATYTNDKLDGYLKIYDNSGKLLKVEYYVDGKLYKEDTEQEQKKEKIIVKKQYYKNGRIKTEGAYKNNKPVGVHRIYDENGKIQKAIVYDNNGFKDANGKIDTTGKRIGKWTFYYPNGKIKAKGEYKNGKKTGKWIFYYSNGKIEQKGKYVNDKPDGYWIWYYPDGTIRREESYYRGYEDGEFVEYYQNGDTLVTGKYLEGMKDGVWTYFVGDEIQTGKYLDDEKMGVWKHYNTDGYLIYQGKYSAGMPTGTHKWYYPDGKIKIIGEFSAGKKNGKWKFFDKNGVLYETVIYKNGLIEKVQGVVQQQDL